MIKIVLGNTYSNISEALGITPETGFQQVIANLKALQKDLRNACIMECSIGELLYLFSQFEIVSYTSMSSNNIIYSEDYTELRSVVDWTWEPSQEDKGYSIHEAWLEIMNDLSEDINELFRYSFAPNSETVIFLNNILKFLANTYIASSPSAIEHYCP